MNESTPTGPTPLTVSDILDLRAYERVRAGYRQRVMAAKRLRRVPLGPIMTVVFESVDTVRFQVHEMARVEKIVTDEGIQAELDVYNKLLPAPGELSATLFIELTSEDELRRWLPALVGIERRLFLDLVAGGNGKEARVPSTPEASHAEALTRESVTPAVHYLRFGFTAEQLRAFDGAEVALVADHPEYQARAPLGAETKKVLLEDLEGRTRPLPYEEE